MSGGHFNYPHFQLDDIIELDTSATFKDIVEELQNECHFNDVYTHEINQACIIEVKRLINELEVKRHELKLIRDRYYDLLNALDYYYSCDWSASSVVDALDNMPKRR
jgi:hypothetical protein